VAIDLQQNLPLFVHTGITLALLKKVDVKLQ